MNNMKPGICDVPMSTMAKRAPRRVCGYVIWIFEEKKQHHNTQILITRDCTMRGWGRQLGTFASHEIKSTFFASGRNDS